jgi:folate-dependent phosphoribosylglycinamide formyltransferase PurN
MRKAIFDPHKSGARMTLVCLVSGSGTNYAQIAAKNPEHNYFVFTNRPGCGAVEIAKKNKHLVIELSHEPYLKGVKEKYGAGNVPRNCPERVKYEQDVSCLIEESIGKKPDLICLAGYDQWTTDWTVDKYYPRILNVHPGDTTRNYVGLHWIPSAKAILAGDSGVRSTLLIVDKSEDKGPVLVQSRLLNILDTLTELEAKGTAGLLTDYRKVVDFARTRHITTYEDFRKLAGVEEKRMMKRMCECLPPALKVTGDWEIFPFAVHVIAEGRVEVEGKTLYLDGKQLPEYGYRMDANTSAG